jgi:hypothetical protein
MSIVTNVLARLGLLRAIRPKISALAPKLGAPPSWISLPSFLRARAWSSPTSAREFHRQELARRTINEFQGRLPVAR